MQDRKGSEKDQQRGCGCVTHARADGERRHKTRQQEGRGWYVKVWCNAESTGLWWLMTHGDPKRGEESMLAARFWKPQNRLETIPSFEETQSGSFVAPTFYHGNFPRYRKLTYVGLHHMINCRIYNWIYFLWHNLLFYSFFSQPSTHLLLLLFFSSWFCHIATGRKRS